MAFSENGVLLGASVVEALMAQACHLRSAEWVARSRLRLLADHVRETVGLGTSEKGLPSSGREFRAVGCWQRALAP